MDLDATLCSLQARATIVVVPESFHGDEAFLQPLNHSNNMFLQQMVAHRI